MYRIVIAALVALLCVVWGCDAHAFIPCETSTRYLCSGKCQALASDSPEWAEVQVCGDSPSAAATDAVAELLLQWECAILDEGDPGPQDDLSCYECVEGEPCHAQGGLLPDGSSATPASQGGLIDALHEVTGEMACLFLPDSAPECAGEPVCGDGCIYECTSKAFGWVDSPFPQFYDVTGSFFYTDCNLSQIRVIATVHENWSDRWPGLFIAPVFTQCSSGVVTHRPCDVGGGGTGTPNPDDGGGDEEPDYCDYYCDGFTGILDPITIGQLAALGYMPPWGSLSKMRFPAYGPTSSLDNMPWTWVVAPCQKQTGINDVSGWAYNDAAYEIARGLAKTQWNAWKAVQPAPVNSLAIQSVTCTDYQPWNPYDPTPP